MIAVLPGGVLGMPGFSFRMPCMHFSLVLGVPGVHFCLSLGMFGQPFCLTFGMVGNPLGLSLRVFSMTLGLVSLSLCIGCLVLRFAHRMPRVQAGLVLGVFGSFSGCFFCSPSLLASRLFRFSGLLQLLLGFSAASEERGGGRKVREAGGQTQSEKAYEDLGLFAGHEVLLRVRFQLFIVGRVGR